ncbi:hypothetical protein Avbf_14295, partial [Armadillidium vulgare]
MKLLLLFLLFFYVNLSKSERILVLTPLGSKSHKIFFMGIVEALAARGHQVTVVSGYAESTQKKNIRDVLIKDFDIDSIVSTSFESPGNAIKNLLLNSPQMCSDTLAQKDVQDLKKEKFDIVMISVFFNYCYLSLVDHFNYLFMSLTNGLTILLLYGVLHIEIFTFLTLLFQLERFYKFHSYLIYPFN